MSVLERTGTRVAVGDADWWKAAVVYQVYPRSFADSDGDGIGDLRGILDHLDHLQALGVDVVWLSPVYPSPQADNGYDISDYRGIDPTFGTLADFDELVAGLHDRGIRLLMDLVVNHTSDRHPWFERSRTGPTPDHRDWYLWRPPRPGRTGGEPGAEPNNWRSFFGGPAWTFDPPSGEYYLHLFAAGQPDLNWEQPQVRAQVHEMMRWWLDRGVDGFRMDVVNFLSKVPGLPDGEPDPVDGLADGSPFFAHGPRLHEYLHEMREQVFGDRPGRFLTVGEMPGVTTAEARLLTDPARREVDMVFQFEHVGLDQGRHKFDPVPLRLVDLKASLGAWQRDLAEVGWNSLYWSNHDQPRVVSRYGDPGRYRRESATALATVLHLHRGTPYVYQGEELGMVNADLRAQGDFRDVESLNYLRLGTEAGLDPAELLAGLRVMSRDTARTPMQWNDGPQAGFTTGTPWIPVNPDHTSLNAAAERADPGSVFHHYRKLIELRHTDPVVVHGSFRMLLPEHDRLYAYTRSLTGKQLLVVANLGGDPVDLPAGALDGRWSDAVLVNTGPAPRLGDGPVTLAPWQALVYRRDRA